MNTTLFIAWRYLFSRKRLNAVNVVSAISAVAIGVVCLALVCVLSIYNGYETLILQQNSYMDPPLRIEPAKGFFLNTQNPRLLKTLANPQIKLYSQRLAVQGIVRGTEGVQPATLVGYDEVWPTMLGDAVNQIDGQLNAATPDGRMPIGLGADLAVAIGAGSDFVAPVMAYVPALGGAMLNPLTPASGFRQQEAHVTAVVMGENEQVRHAAYLPIAPLRAILGCAADQATAIEVMPHHDVVVKDLQTQLRKELGEGYRVISQTEMHPEVGRLVQVEKWMSFLILLFIMLLASFNIVSSLSMLMLEKEQDVATLRSMGAPIGLVKRIFVTEGMLISLLGALVGLLLGSLLCLLQQHYGWLTYRMGMIEVPYPVELQMVDLLVVLLTMTVMSLLSALYPVIHLGRKWCEKEF